jgi:multidrug efflux pump subunit AcrB
MNGKDSKICDSETAMKEQQSNPQETSKELGSDASSTGEAAEEASKRMPESIKSEEREYISGLKLGMVLVGVTLVCFLVLLDTSIIVTVSCPKGWRLQVPSGNSDVSRRFP